MSLTYQNLLTAFDSLDWRLSFSFGEIVTAISALVSTLAIGITLWVACFTKRLQNQQNILSKQIKNLQQRQVKASERQVNNDEFKHKLRIFNVFSKFCKIFDIHPRQINENEYYIILNYALIQHFFGDEIAKSMTDFIDKIHLIQHQKSEKLEYKLRYRHGNSEIEEQIVLDMIDFKRIRKELIEKFKDLKFIRDMSEEETVVIISRENL